jgi:hypothetical protein
LSSRNSSFRKWNHGTVFVLRSAQLRAIFQFGSVRRSVWISSIVRCGTALQIGFVPDVLYSLDFLAPKAKQYTWFLEFLEVSSKSLFAPPPPGEVEENQQLRLDAFPGMAFAKAWALWQVEAGQKKVERVSTLISVICRPTHATLQDHEGSTDALRSAILKFPMVIPLLFDKLGVNPPKQFAEDWRTALQSTFS